MILGSNDISDNDSSTQVQAACQLSPHTDGTRDKTANTDFLGS